MSKYGWFRWKQNRALLFVVLYRPFFNSALSSACNEYLAAGLCRVVQRSSSVASVSQYSCDLGTLRRPSHAAAVFATLWPCCSPVQGCTTQQLFDSIIAI